MPGSGGVTINKIAKAARVDPRRARALLRKEKKLPPSISETRWIFKPRDVSKIKALIRR